MKLATPFPRRPNPYLVFRMVRRDERVVYARSMRRTYAVAMRDFDREVRKFERALGRALLPVVQRTADQLNKILRVK